MLSEFYYNNLEMIYFFYGLAFFTMGISISVKIRRHSSFTLGHHLWALSAFGISHGLAEWMTVFFPIHFKRMNQLGALAVLEIVFIGLSFAFLFRFGMGLLADSKGMKSFYKYLPWFVFFAWVSIFLSGGLIHNDQAWAVLALVWSRYLLALPGSILTAWALYLQIKEVQYIKVKTIVFDLKGTSLVFLAYGLFAGVIVNTAPFFPASIINKKYFLQITGIPVELLRATCALAIAWFSVSIQKIFRFEEQEMIQEVERTRASYNEREKIREELHDGIIQSIYAVGIRLECASRSLTESDPAKEHIKWSIENLNQVINDVRGFLGGLRLEICKWEELKNSLAVIAKEMLETQQIDVVILYQGEENNFLRSYEIELIYRICKEALHNVSKHSKATSAAVKFNFGPDGCYLEISDNGVGFNPGGLNPGNGIGFMYNRTKKLGGHLTVESHIGKGTILKLWIRDKSQGGDARC